MKETILNFDQETAMRLDLDLTDIILIVHIDFLSRSSKSKKIEWDGEQYVWVSYQNIVDWLPILKLKKRAVASRVDTLVAKGVLAKHINHEGGTYVYLRLLIPEAMQSQRQGGCSFDNRGLLSEQHPKKSSNTKDKKINKEKDNNKLLSKKKVAKFEAVLKEFRERIKTDESALMSLGRYDIEDFDELVEQYRAYLENTSRCAEFVADSFPRQRMKLMWALPKMDLRKAVASTLGKGEFMMNGRRYYVNPRGSKKEVPMDAPPRQSSDTIWNGERWIPFM